jgi:ribonuclease G
VQLYKDRPALFETYDLQPTIDAALRRTVALPNGGYLTIDKTEALTAIDVNTGRFVGKKNLEETILQTNLEAAEEAVRQLRLRDIGGIIIIDFIDMEEAISKQRLLERLSAALERDRTKTRMSEISRLGLVEITRKNVTEGLYGVLTESCPTCKGEGRVVSRTTRRIAVERRMREILRQGKSNAYLFGLNPQTYELVNAPGLNTAATLRAETGKQVSIVADEEAGATEVRILIEGRTGLLRRAFD